MKLEHSILKRALCACLGLFLICAGLYLNFFASSHIRSSAEATQIDKLLHIIGGAFLVSWFEWRGRPAPLWQIFGIISLLFLGWKAFEFFTDAAARYEFISMHFRTWAFDFTGDFAATMLGSIIYWRICMHKPRPQLFLNQK